MIPLGVFGPSGGGVRTPIKAKLAKDLDLQRFGSGSTDFIISSCTHICLRSDQLLQSCFCVFSAMMLRLLQTREFDDYKAKLDNFVEYCLRNDGVLMLR